MYFSVGMKYETMTLMIRLRISIQVHIFETVFVSKEYYKALYFRYFVHFFHIMSAMCNFA